MSSPHVVPKPIARVQNIKCNGNETEFSAEVVGQNVYVHGSQGSPNHGSSKVKLTNRSDYNWEFKYYYGNLVAAHISGKIIAYAMKGKDGGMVRVSNLECDRRAIIKNLKDDIKDVSFAYSRQEIILGVIDCEGNILIYEINDEPNAITYNLLLHIYHHDNVNRIARNYFRLIWCPYLPNFDEDVDTTDDPEKMFVVLNGDKAEVCNVTMMTQKYGNGPLDPDDSFEGYIEVNHSSHLVDAAFSSDGTAIAIACSDGFVKFFQLYMVDSEKQKCLHEWRPHENKPLSSIIFIDNVLEYSTECWKFTITGAVYNSEIKLWSCESWSCLQTINFTLGPGSMLPNQFLNIGIDYTGQYLLLSDINNKLLNVLQLKRNDKEQMVQVTTLSQFLLPNPFLSFHILEASTKKVPYSYNNSTEDLYDDDRDDFEEESYTSAVFLKMLVIQPKKFQECNITFQPEALMSNSSSSMSDICDNETEKLPKLDDLQSSVTLLIQQQSNKTQMNLMTPEDFASPPHNSRPSSVRNSVGKNDVTTSESLENLKETEVDNLIEFPQPQKDSGGSSPSREVQEILSLNNSNYSNQDYFEMLSAMKDEQDDQKKYSETGETVWPKIPVVNDNDLISDNARLADEASTVSKSQLQSINFRINSLENIIREQNTLMVKMQQSIKDLSQVNRNKCEKDDFVKELDSAMAKQNLQMAKMLENLINMQKSNERNLQEEIVTGVGQLMTKSLTEKLQAIASHEMKHTVLPAIKSLVDTYKHHVDTQYAQRLNNTDAMLKDNITKALNNKALAESLSLSVVNTVAPSLEKCYKDVISSSLVPSWERICNTMFQQINETFTRGTKEYTASVENYMDKQRRAQEKGKDIIAQIQNVSDGIKNNADKFTSTLTTEIHKQFNSAFKNMQEKLTHNIKDIVNEQVKQGFKNHASVIEDSVINAVRSRAVTPSPHVDNHVTLAHIQYHLNREKYDDALQMALSAENLAFVIFVCERVEITAIFGEECLLPQTCLLALIQQLSMELQKNTDLKLSYIRAAFLSLNPDHQATKPFIPQILNDLLRQLQMLVQSNPSIKHMNDAKLLKMAIENMIGKK